MVILHSYVSSLEGKLPFADPHLKNLWTSQLFSSPREFGIPKISDIALRTSRKGKSRGAVFMCQTNGLTHFKSGSIPMTDPWCWILMLT